MKHTDVAIAVAALIMLAAAGPVASGVNYSVVNDGSLITYTYTLTSEEVADTITSFHVYAPIDCDLVNGWSITAGWDFAADVDPETDGADAYWYAVNADTGGLAYGSSLQVKMTAPASATTIYDYTVPGFLGNWGYETYQWAGCGVFVMMPPVPVPQGALPGVPEPMGAVVLALGCAALVRRARSSAKAR